MAKEESKTPLILISVFVFVLIPFAFVTMLHYLKDNHILHYVPGIIHVCFVTINFLYLMAVVGVAELKDHFVYRYTGMSLATSSIFFILSEVINHYSPGAKSYVILGCFFTILYSTFIHWLITSNPAPAPAPSDGERIKVD